MSESVKREEDWEEVSSTDSQNEDSESLPSDDVHLGELLVKMSIWTKSVFKKMDIMTGDNNNNLRSNFNFRFRNCKNPAKSGHYRKNEKNH